MTTPRVSLLVLVLLALTATSSTQPTIYEFVSWFGFPPGIFPDSVTSYTAAPQGNGYTFEISLRRPCFVYYDFYVQFDTQITGYITSGKITFSKGLSGRPYNMFWWPVDEMILNGDSITYTIAFMKVDVFLYYFEWIPDCDYLMGANRTRASNLISKLPVKAKGVGRKIME